MLQNAADAFRFILRRLLQRKKYFAYSCCYGDSQYYYHNFRMPNLMTVALHGFGVLVDLVHVWFLFCPQIFFFPNRKASLDVGISCWHLSATAGTTC